AAPLAFSQPASPPDRRRVDARAERASLRAAAPPVATRRARPGAPGVTRPSLTVIGLDAATARVVDPLLERGDLPNLARLCEAGSRGTLRSTTPPLTSQAWATAFTGVNAGMHGLWEFMERDESGYRFRLVNGSFRRAPAVWDYLSAAGRAVG